MGLPDWKRSIVELVAVKQRLAEVDTTGLWKHALPAAAATEAQLRMVEHHIGETLDPVCRAFLRHANGWPRAGTATRPGRASTPAAKAPPPRPAALLDICEQIAKALARRAWRPRTGNAPGADQAFERGAGPDVFLPWLVFPQATPILGDMHATRRTGVRDRSRTPVTGGFVSRELADERAAPLAVGRAPAARPVRGRARRHASG